MDREKMFSFLDGASEGYKQGRADGINDLEKAIVEKFAEYEKRGYKNHTNDGIKLKVIEIAERLKESEQAE